MKQNENEIKIYDFRLIFLAAIKPQSEIIIKIEI